MSPPNAHSGVMGIWWTVSDYQSNSVFDGVTVVLSWLASALYCLARDNRRLLVTMFFFKRQSDLGYRARYVLFALIRKLLSVDISRER